MKNDSHDHNQHRAARANLRRLGIGLVVTGGVFTAIGMISFFSSFGSFEPPKYFWCAFIGLPMLGFGSMLCQFGFLGAITRFQAREVTPVVSDAFNELADGTQGGIHKVARALGSGLSSGMQGETGKVCPDCGGSNDESARFCDQCGASMAPPACPSCGQLNDSGARFCDQCGTAIAN